MREAMKEGAPIIHDQEDYVHFADSDPTKNLAAKIRINIGDVDKGFSEADLVLSVNTLCQRYNKLISNLM